MLTKLSIRNFAITEKVDVEWLNGFTTITGETGAGKSILLSALKLVLGDKSSPAKIRKGAEKCEITAIFNISDNQNAAQELLELGLADFDNPHELIVRKLITKNGSKSYINDTSVKASSIKKITKNLIDIHGQSEHHNLLNKDFQLLLLDQYSGAITLKNEVSEASSKIRLKEQEIEKILENQKNNADKIELLNYQLKDLDELDLAVGEYTEMYNKYTNFKNSENIKTTISEAIDEIHEGDETIIDKINNILKGVGEIDELNNVKNLLSEAVVSLEETKSELSDAFDSFEIDNDDLYELENKILNIERLSKSHKVLPEYLHEKKESLKEELDALSISEDGIDDIERDLVALKDFYQKKALSLSELRKEFSVLLAQGVSYNIEQLKINKNAFKIDLICYTGDNKYPPNGNETVNFTFCPNTGHPFDSLSKIASGGELSRVSLAIQLELAYVANLNTLIFDEVDVGIGGSTAAVIGRMLRNLGDKSQVISITHQPQVAAQGNQHIKVFKHMSDEKTYHGMKYLDEDSREKEIARMLSSHEITENTIKLAKDMLNCK